MIGSTLYKLHRHDHKLEGQESGRNSLAFHEIRFVDGFKIRAHASGHAFSNWSCQLKLSSRGLLII